MENGILGWDLKQLNYVRKFLKVITLSDISTSDGKKLAHEAYIAGQCGNGLRNDLKWPYVPSILPRPFNAFWEKRPCVNSSSFPTLTRTIDNYHGNLGRGLTPVLRTSGFGIPPTMRAESIAVVVTDGSCITVQDVTTALRLIDTMALLWIENRQHRLLWFRWVSVGLLASDANIRSNLLLCGLWLLIHPMLTNCFAGLLPQSWVRLTLRLLIYWCCLTRLYY